MIISAQRIIVCTWRQSASPMPLFPPVTRMRCAITAYVRDSLFLQRVEIRPILEI
jgi:hypothetical protein